MDRETLEKIIEELTPGKNITCNKHLSTQQIDYLQISKDSIYVSFNCGCMREYSVYPQNP